MRLVILALTLAGGIAVCGCSKSGGTPAKAAANVQPVKATPAASKPVEVPANATPEQVVTVFLQALRSGDSPTTESLLTTKARTELGKHQMSVDVQAAPNAVYQVEKATLVPNQPTIAHVNSLWTEKFENEQGRPAEEKYAIVWGLRRQTEGWRVAGMQVELVPGLRPYLDFEDPEDMMKKRDEALSAMQPPLAQAGATSPVEAPAIQTAQQPPVNPLQQPAPRVER